MKNLQDLPADVLLLIFTYIPSEHLIRSVSMVCVEFRDILNSKSFWKRRYNRKSGRNLNLLHDWRVGCCQNDHLQQIIEGKATVNTYKGRSIYPSKIVWFGQMSYCRILLYNRIYCYSGRSTYHAR